jgi:hypothetical protein
MADLLELDKMVDLPAAVDGVEIQVEQVIVKLEHQILLLLRAIMDLRQMVRLQHPVEVEVEVEQVELELYLLIHRHQEDLVVQDHLILMLMVLQIQ